MNVTLNQFVKVKHLKPSIPVLQRWILLCVIVDSNVFILRVTCFSWRDLAWNNTLVSEFSSHSSNLTISSLNPSIYLVFSWWAISTLAFFYQNIHCPPKSSLQPSPNSTAPLVQPPSCPPLLSFYEGPYYGILFGIGRLDILLVSANNFLSFF